LPRAPGTHVHRRLQYGERPDVAGREETLKSGHLVEGGGGG
jgi:hypothetical protein